MKEFVAQVNLMNELATKLEALEDIDLLRVLASAAHEFQHRRPDVPTDRMAAMLASEIDEVHREGLA